MRSTLLHTLYKKLHVAIYGCCAIILLTACSGNSGSSPTVADDSTPAADQTSDSMLNDGNEVASVIPSQPETPTAINQPVQSIDSGQSIDSVQLTETVQNTETSQSEEPTQASEDQPVSATTTDGDSAASSDTTDSIPLDVVEVTVDIIVPAYQSNALQVRVVWGDKDLQAAWVGDEMWTLADNFPVNTEHALTVWFYDNNGGTTLGTAEQTLATDNNSTQIVTVNANDFDTERWDDDSDSVSNLEELRVGTDPFESNALTTTPDLQDAYFTPYSGWSASAAEYYESNIRELDFPVDINTTDFIDRLPFTSETTVTTIALSETGNGTYSETYDFFIALDMPFNETSVATRSSDKTTVSWSGTDSFYGSNRYYGAAEHLFETVNTIKGNTLIQQGNGTLVLKRHASDNTGNTLNYNYNLVLDLDSINDENTCKILYGSSYHSFDNTIDDTGLAESTIVRDVTDEYWYWEDTSAGETTSGKAIEREDRLYCDYKFNTTR